MVVVMLSRTDLRKRVRDTLLLEEPWKESGEPYDRFGWGADEDMHQRFSLKLGPSQPYPDDRQKTALGVMVRTALFIRWCFELRSPPHTTEDELVAEEQQHRLVKRLHTISRSADLSFMLVGVEQPFTDEVEGRWMIGGLIFEAAHRLALE